MAKKIDKAQEIEPVQIAQNAPSVDYKPRSTFKERIEFWLSDSGEAQPKTCITLINVTGNPYAIGRKKWKDFIAQIVELVPCYQDQYDGTIRITLAAFFLEEPGNDSSATQHTISDVFAKESNGKLAEILYNTFVLTLLDNSWKI